MVRLSGAAALLVIAMAPALVVPSLPILGVGILAAVVGFSGVLLRSLALATIGAIGALLVFSVALLLAPAGNASLAGTLMGIGIVALLDSAHYQQRFGHAAIGAGVVGRHLTDLTVTALLSFLVAGALAVWLTALSAGMDATLRPFAAAAGGILLVLAVLRRVTRHEET